jgi:hypothetical protein
MLPHCRRPDATRPIRERIHAPENGFDRAPSATRRTVDSRVEYTLIPECFVQAILMFSGIDWLHSLVTIGYDFRYGVK